MIVGGLFAVVVAACGMKEADKTVTPTVHLGATGFIQDSITLQKGEMLDLVDDTVSPHHIENGSWMNGVTIPALDPGAPLVDQVLNGYDSAEVGPFRTAGAFHFYCAIHQNMNPTALVTQADAPSPTAN